jgi:hypothetical protein
MQLRAQRSVLGQQCPIVFFGGNQRLVGSSQRLIEPRVLSQARVETPREWYLDEFARACSAAA